MIYCIKPTYVTVLKEMQKEHTYTVSSWAYMNKWVGGGELISRIICSWQMDGLISGGGLKLGGLLWYYNYYIYYTCIYNYMYS